MEVLFTIPNLDRSSGGTASAVTALANSIASEKFYVTICAVKNNKKIIPFERSQFLDLNLFSNHNFLLSQLNLYAGFSKAFSSNIGENDYKLIHNHGIWMALNHYASILATQKKIPLVISPHGMLEPWAMQFKKFKKKMAWMLYQYRDLQKAMVLHATAVQEATNFRNLGFRQPVAIIPNGVLAPKQSRIGSGDDSLRSVLFLSRIHPKKGLFNLADAWKALSPHGWKIVIAGPDEAGHQAEVLAHIKNLGLESSFEFVGPIYGDGKWKLFAQSDLFVLPSFSENFGIVIAEALAAGVPVITTQSTPWQELKTHKCGWWIDVGVDPLVGALREAMALSESERKAMGARGRQLVQDSYSWPKIGSDMVSVYEWVLGGGSPPSCVMTD